MLLGTVSVFFLTKHLKHREVYEGTVLLGLSGEDGHSLGSERMASFMFWVEKLYPLFEIQDLWYSDTA